MKLAVNCSNCHHYKVNNARFTAPEEILTKVSAFDSAVVEGDA